MSVLGNDMAQVPTVTRDEERGLSTYLSFGLELWSRLSLGGSFLSEERKSGVIGTGRGR